MRIKCLFAAAAIVLIFGLFTDAQVPITYWEIKGPVEPETDLIALYHFDETTGNALDSSTSGATPLVPRGTPARGMTGVFSNATALSGVVGMFYNSTAKLTLPSESNFTFCAWVYPNNTHSSSIGMVVDVGTYSAAAMNGAALGMYQSKFYISIFNTTTASAVITTGTIRVGVWNHICVVFNSTRFIAYNNGTQVSTSGAYVPGTLNFSTPTVVVGQNHRQDGFNQAFNGTIDEVSIFNRSLSSDEISIFYNSAITEFAPQSNFAQFISYPVTINSTVGFGDNTTRNYSTTNITGSTYLVFNSTWTTTDPQWTVTRLNNTHWDVRHAYNNIMNGQYNESHYACGGNNLITCDNFTENVAYYQSPYNFPIYPTANIDVTSPVSVSCNYTGGLTPAGGFYFYYNITNSTSHVYSNSTLIGGCSGIEGSPPCDYYGYTNVFPPINLTNGDYNLTCSIKIFPSGPEYNSSFTPFRVVSSILNPSTYNGDCSTTKGAYYNYINPSAPEWVFFNFTGLSPYLRNANMTNIWVEGGGASYKLADNILAVRTNAQTNLVVWITGYDHIYNYTTLSLSGTNVTVNLTSISNFTLQNNLYLVDIKNENTGLYANYTNATEELFKVQCLQHSPSVVDLKALGNLTQIVIATSEQPTFQLITALNYTSYSTYQIRKVDADNSSGRYTLYQAENQPLIQQWSFTLNDFTGRYRGSGKLKIIGNVNNTLQVIHDEPWNFQTLSPIYLQNNTDYLIQVYIPYTATISYGWITVTGDGNKVLSVTEPVITNGINHWSGITYQFLSDYATQTIGMVYNVTTNGTNSVIFKVYNSTNDLLDTQTLTTDYGVFSFVAPYNNASYYVTASFDVQNHSILDINTPLGLSHTLTTVSGYSFAGLAAAIGYDENHIKTFIVWLVISIIILSASAVHIGVFALLAAMASWMMYSFGWLSAGYASLVVFTFIIAVLIKVAGDRQRSWGD